MLILQLPAADSVLSCRKPSRQAHTHTKQLLYAMAPPLSIIIYSDLFLPRLPQLSSILATLHFRNSCHQCFNLTKMMYVNTANYAIACSNAISKLPQPISIVHQWQGCLKLTSIFHQWQGRSKLTTIFHQWQGCLKLTTIFHQWQGCLKLMSIFLRWQGCQTCFNAILPKAVYHITIQILRNAVLHFPLSILILPRSPKLSLICNPCQGCQRVYDPSYAKATVPRTP